MKKYLLILFSVSFMMGSSINPLYKLFKKSIMKKESTLITKTTKTVNESSYINKILKNSTIKVYKPIDKLALSASLIAKKGDVVKNITKQYPLKMVRYYSKYGDEFITITNKMLPKIENIKLPTNLIEKYNLKNIAFLKNKELIAKRFLDVMKYTGKKGFEISKSLLKYANKHKFSTIAGVAFAWFLSDPESFNEALDKFGGNVAEFLASITKAIGSTIAKTVNKSSDALVSSFSDMLNLQNILILLGLLSIIILWKLRKIIVNLFKSNKKRVENQTEQTKNRSRYE